jgi:uncharacterized protein (DUF39 family)
MTKNYQKINDKIKSGKVDVVTTGTFGAMCRLTF